MAYYYTVPSSPYDYDYRQTYGVMDSPSQFATPWYLPSRSQPFSQPFHQPSTPSFQHPAPHKVQNIVTPRKTRQAISKVPTEIWMHILTLCLPSDPSDAIPSRRRGPLKCTHICHGLRRIAHSMSELWSTICLTPNRYGAFPDKKLVRQWLDLAGNRGLTIIFQEGEKSPKHTKEAAPIFRELLRVIHNWESVLLWHAWTWKMPELSVGEGSPRMLKSLSLHGSIDINEISPFITQLIGSAPQLSSLSWVDQEGKETHYWPGFLQKFPLNFRRLTDLDLKNPLDTSELLYIFSQSPNLVNCSIGNLVSEQNLQAMSGPVCLPHLRSLKLIVDFERFLRRERKPILSSLLSTISAPSLRELHLGYDECWSQKFFDHFLQNSRCRLESLTFDVVTLSEGDLQKTLQSMTTMTQLQSLELKTGSEATSPLTQGLIQLMCPTQPYCLVPTLRHISVNEESIKDSNGAFANMIYYRLAVRSPFLRSVSLYGSFKNRRRVPDYKMIKDMCKHGLSVAINP